MATLRNKKKLPPLNKENCEEHPRSNVAQNSSVPRSQEDYITQVFEEIEWRVTKKLSQEFNKTENRILGALSRLDDFLMNPLIQGHSRTAPEMSRNAYGINQGTNEEDSQTDPHPEAGILHNQTTQNSGPEDGLDNSSRTLSFLRLSKSYNKDQTCHHSEEENQRFRLCKTNFHCFELLSESRTFENFKAPHHF